MIAIMRHFTKRDWFATAGAVLLIALSVYLELLMPDYMKEITELLVIPGSEIPEILWAGAKMLLCALASLIVSVLVTVISGFLAADYSYNVRAKLYDAVESFSMAEINRFSTASLITRSTNDITQVQTIIVFGLFVIVRAPLMGKAELFLDMTVFSQYALMVIMAFMMLNMIFIMGPRSLVAAHRINEVIDTKSSISDGKGVEHTDKEGEIEFRNVSFKYPDAADYVLKDISFTAHKGETVAIIGSTGCGKSTLINLIPRFYDATEGEVLVDGVNVKDYTLEQLHNKLGYIPQRAVLFSGTVNTNVAMGSNGTEGYTQEDVTRAVEIAQAKDVVENYPEGYEHPVAQGGSNLSGGQKQRLCIARAVCRNPEVLIFDDSFSALDYKTDRILRETLKKETAGTTNIIVAQRIGTIKDADQIIVLDEGKIAAIGKHKELLKTCEIYHEIGLSQLGEEELNYD